MVNALNTEFSDLYAQQSFAPYTVAGQTTGEYKNAGTFSYVRIYGAGHEVPAYTVRIFGRLLGYGMIYLIRLPFFLVWDISCWASSVADVQSDYVGSAVEPDMSPGPVWFLVFDSRNCNSFSAGRSYGVVTWPDELNISTHSCNCVVSI